MNRPSFFCPGFRQLALLVCFSFCFGSSLKADWKWENDLADAQVTPTEYIASFTFTNTGEKELSVSSIQSCCNCTTHSHSATTAQQGKTGTLTIVIDRAKSKTSKKVFDFLIIGTDATSQKLQIRVPDAEAKP